MNEYVEDLLTDSQKYETWFITVINSILYKDKTLQEWEEFLNLLDASSSVSPDQVEEYNNKLLNLTEIIMSNCAYSKVTFLKADAMHKEALLKARETIIEELSSSTVKKSPSADAMEKMCEMRCIESFKLLESSRAIFEFWNIHSFKLNRLHDRLTSLNILKKNGY